PSVLDLACKDVAICRAMRGRKPLVVAVSRRFGRYGQLPLKVFGDFRSRLAMGGHFGHPAELFGGANKFAAALCRRCGAILCQRAIEPEARSCLTGVHVTSVRSKAARCGNDGADEKS